MEVKMNDLPELPFEKILGYLSLEDLIRSRAVSRRWCQTIDSFKVKSLCFSDRPSGCIFKKSRWVNGAFVQNFIGPARFESFFGAFSTTIFSNLKNLRLCELSLCEENGPAFGRTLSSFDQLEKLGLYRFNYPDSDLEIKFKLNLPMLNSIHLEHLCGIRKVTVTAPKLQNVKFGYCSKYFRLVILPNAESVETLATLNVHHIKLEKFKNLKYYYDGPGSGLDHDILFRLEHLREVHLSEYLDFVHPNAWHLLDPEKKPEALKIFLFGFLMGGRDDPALRSIATEMGQVKFGYLAENYTRLSTEFFFVEHLWYKEIEPVASTELAISVLKRFTDLYKIVVNKPVEDIDRFLTILKNLDNLAELRFVRESQPQELYDRLPENCALQHLFIWSKPPKDLSFLSRLANLIRLELACSTDVEFISKVYDEHPFLRYFGFMHAKLQVSIRVDRPKGYQVWVAREKRTDCPDLNAAIQFIFEMATEDLPNSSSSH